MLAILFYFVKCFLKKCVYFLKTLWRIEELNNGTNHLPWILVVLPDINKALLGDVHFVDKLHKII